MAIKKYGVENVHMRALAIGDKEYIEELEIKAIAAYSTLDRAFGYNLALGGSSSPMHSPEIAERMKATLRLKMENDDEFMQQLMRQARALNSPAVGAPCNAAIRKPEVSAAKSLKLTGYKHSDAMRANVSAALSRPEVKAKQSASVRAAWASPELRAAQSARFKGRTVSDEQRAKISASLMGHEGYGKGQKRDPEIVAKTAEKNRGRKNSEESKQRMREAQARRFDRLREEGKPLFSEETRAKMGRASADRMRGVPKSQETRERIRKTLTGKKHSPETIEKMRQSQLARNKREREQRLAAAAE
jgi:hypothetical protein